MSTSTTTITRPLTILVTGATGTQGSAVINALLTHPSLPPSTSILALTRNPASAKSVSLAAKSPQITLVQGDLDDAAAIFTSLPPQHKKITTVFSVQNNLFGSPAKHAIEETQARGLIDAAVANGVAHFVQSTGDRGGAEKSEWDETDVPHFQTKFRNEKYLMQRCAATAAATGDGDGDGDVKTKMTYTILRPVSFMDNLTPDLHGKGFAAMWHCMGKEKALQLISARDIGVFAANAIVSSPDDPVYRNRAISIAGDELTQVEADGVFRKIFQGKPMPRTFAVVGTVVKWSTPELGKMFEWFEKVGFGADVQMCKRLNPGMMDLERWLREESGFVEGRVGTGVGGVHSTE